MWRVGIAHQRFGKKSRNAQKETVDEAMSHGFVDILSLKGNAEDFIYLFIFQPTLERKLTFHNEDDNTRGVKKKKKTGL